MAPVSEQQEPEYSIPDSNSLRSGDIANIVIGIITAVAAIIALLIKARKLRARDQSPVTTPVRMLPIILDFPKPLML